MTRPVRMKKSEMSRALAKAWGAIGEGAPELLSDADFVAMKAPPRAKPQQKERKSQAAGVIFLRKHLPRGSLVYAIPNASRSREHRFSLLRDGLLPGMPDLGIIVPWPEPFLHRTFRIEWKRPGGGALSQSQIEVHAQLRALGVPLLSECRGTDEAVEWLREQGVKI